MERRLSCAPAAVVRHVLAAAWLDAAPAGSITLGGVVLRPHQVEAVERVRRVLASHRVALLADAVGLGKTYVALAIARDARRPVIVAPAGLRQMWADALARAELSAGFLSYEQLSRRACMPDESPDLVILDEAHHARAPGTRRYAHIAELVRSAALLLVSATPIHNSRRDVTALFALALGQPARALSDDQIALHVVRRTHDDVPVGMVPAVARPEVILIEEDDAVLRQLVALPPPVPPRDAGDGGALLTWTLVRLWASTRGALRAALRRRLQRGWALVQSLSAGVLPTRAELAAWQCSDDAIQLAFPELLARPSESAAALLSNVRQHLAGVEALLRQLAPGDDPDVARAAALRRLRTRAPGERIVVFTQFADSAMALWRLLRTDPGVAVLTSGGAQVAGGTLTRRAALRRFAPLASGAHPSGPAEAIELLIATDLLSEGVNLQDATTVVHLDLPWTHARFEQRVGRVRRIGATHAEVKVVTFAPPAPAERLLELERRIARKLGAAARTVGIAGAILPSVLQRSSPLDQSPAQTLEVLRTVLGRWRGRSLGSAGDAPVAAMVRGDRPGAIALVCDQESSIVVAIREGSVSADPRTVLEFARIVDGADDVPPDESRLERDRLRIERWVRVREAERLAGGSASLDSAPRRATLRRLAATLARTPISRRHEVAPLAARARRVATGIIGIGGELVLGQLAAAPLPDEAWLRAVAAFADVHASPHTPASRLGMPRLVALISVAAPERPPGKADRDAPASGGR